jgi:pyrroloquinoline quinone (PQQ) biosynthesis protein C
MSNFQRLESETAAARQQLLSVPVIHRALRGEVDRATYLAFLSRAWHHVRHTVPLLMAVGARLPDRSRWLQDGMVHYATEELGHDEWILNDIGAAGGDAEAVRGSTPGPEVDAMVAYAYDMVMRRNPAGFFGMVYVLEGTSVALALEAAARLQASLALPERAFSYLRSHGRLDQEHVGHLREIIDRLDEQDLVAVIACAKTMFWLYANVFRSLESPT